MRARDFVGACAVALALSSTAAAWAATVLGDVSDGALLTADGDGTIETDLASALLLVEIVREHVVSGAVTGATPVPLAIEPSDHGAKLGDHRALPLGELLQLLLLTRSPLATRSLAQALGAGAGGVHAGMVAAAAHLGLHDTTVSEYPFGAPARTTATDLGRLGLAIAGDPELRRRLTLDGVPIADGDYIIRATSPLIAVTPPRQGPGHAGSGPVLALAREGDLDLLAVTTDPDAEHEAWRLLEAAHTRYERIAVVKEGQPVGPDVEVRNGIIPRFNAIAAEPFAITIERGVAHGLGARVQLPPAVEAPIEVRQEVGELIIEQREQIIAVIPLVAPRTIAPNRWLDAATMSR